MKLGISQPVRELSYTGMLLAVTILVLVTMQGIGGFTADGNSTIDYVVSAILIVAGFFGLDSWLQSSQC